jgi:hypothetical protein
MRENPGRKHGTLCFPKIDLSLLRQIENPELLEHIQRVGVVFFERDT